MMYGCFYLFIFLAFYLPEMLIQGRLSFYFYYLKLCEIVYNTDTDV